MESNTKNQLVTTRETKDNFQSVTKETDSGATFLPFAVFFIFLILCAGLVYFLRGKRSAISPGQDFKIIE